LRVLVTGGAGFIGSNFVRRSLEVDPSLKITVLDALTYAGSLQNLQESISSIRFVQGDIRDLGLVDELVKESDLVVHFAAESHNDNSLNNPSLFVETNVNGTLTLIEACRKYDVRFHHISTDEVFGDLPLDSEDSFTLQTPYNPSSPYSASKASSDLLVRAWVRSFGLRATISNCSNNYGPNQHWEKLIPNTIRLIHMGQKPTVYGTGANIRDWIHVEDHTDGIWAVIKGGIIASTYLLGARDTRSNLEIVKAILKTMGKPEDWMNFVEDRAGHDLKYSIDPSEAELGLGWKPRYREIDSVIPDLVEHYVAKLEGSS